MNDFHPFFLREAEKSDVPPRRFSLYKYIYKYKCKVNEK